ncbi:MAG: I78 family peptidase inhibitor [Pseudoxanthomonas sp.]
MPKPLRIVAAILYLAVGACAQAPVSVTATPQAADQPASPAHCDATNVTAAVGRLPSVEVVEAARKDAGAEVVRTLRPGQAITREFRIGRLNLVLDAEGRIASAHCS